MATQKKTLTGDAPRRATRVSQKAQKATVVTDGDAVDQLLRRIENHDIRLIHSSFSMLPQSLLKDYSEDDMQLTYDVGIRISRDSIDTDIDNIFGFVDFTMERIVSDKEDFHLEATYVCFIILEGEMSRSQKRCVFRHLCQYTVAPVFREHAMSIIGQSGESSDLPPPPLYSHYVQEEGEFN